MATVFAETTGESFTFDGVKAESWEHSATITAHPVEDLGFVTDHRQKTPLRLSVNGVVTATPILLDNGQIQDGRQRLQAAKRFFDLNQDSIFSYTSVRLGLIGSLLLESYNFEVDKESRIEFVLGFKEVIFGNTELVDLPPIRTRRLEPPVNNGDQPGEEVEGEIRKRTSLSRGAGGNIVQDIREGATRALDSITDSLTGGR
jgi:hypothetical protein